MVDLRRFEADLSSALRKIGPHTPFVEVFAESQDGEGVRVDRRSVTPNRSPHLEGGIFRAWGPGRWVEAAASTMNGAAIDRAVDALVQGLARAPAVGHLPGTRSNVRQEWIETPTRPMRDVPLADSISLAQDALRWATGVSGIHECTVHIGWVEEERFYLNSAGARCSRNEAV